MSGGDEQKLWALVIKQLETMVKSPNERTRMAAMRVITEWERRRSSR